jgi:hypothetical protein
MWTPLVALYLIRIRDLLHHAFVREQPSERCTSIAPMSPSIVWPILVVGALGPGKS